MRLHEPDSQKLITKGIKKTSLIKKVAGRKKGHLRKKMSEFTWPAVSQSCSSIGWLSTLTTTEKEKKKKTSLGRN